MDPELEGIKIYRRTAERMTRVAELTAERGDQVTTPLLPDFSISVAAVFAAAW